MTIARYIKVFVRNAFFIVAVLFSQSLLAQDTSSVKFKSQVGAYIQFNTYSYKKTKNQKWAASDKTKTFENQGELHSFYIALNIDFTFTFLAFGEAMQYISVGKWEKDKRKIKLMWNEELTDKMRFDESKKDKFCSGCLLEPMDVQDWVFIFKKSKLFPTQTRKIDDAQNIKLNIPASNAK